LVRWLGLIWGEIVGLGNSDGVIEEKL